MMRSIAVCAALMAALIAPGSMATGGSTENLLFNPKFFEGMPDGWEPDSFRTGAKFEWQQAQRRLSIFIPADSPNDARWTQRVVVKPNTRYRLSGWVRVLDVTPTIDTLDVGANLSILEDLPERGSFTHTEPMLGTQAWQHKSVSFDTGTNDIITIALRLGMYSGQTTGKAWFRWVKLVELE